MPHRVRKGVRLFFIIEKFRIFLREIFQTQRKADPTESGSKNFDPEPSLLETHQLKVSESESWEYENLPNPNSSNERTHLITRQTDWLAKSQYAELRFS